MKQLRQFLYIIILISISQNTWARLPYFWDLGGNGSFLPYFEKDSVHFSHLEMQSQKLSILLYKGFAVMKGEYQMYNNSQEEISLRLGFPAGGVYTHPNLQTVSFLDLHKLLVLEQGDSIVVEAYARDQEGISSTQPYFYKPDNWLTWMNRFPAQDTTQLTIYYLVNTNYANLRQGYGRDTQNGFTYALSSASVWAGTLPKGEIRVQLADELTLEDIQGMLPFTDWQASEQSNHLLYTFQSLEPKESQNLIIRYGEQLPSLNFKEVKKQAAEYYQLVDQFHTKALSSSDFNTFIAKDFKVYDWKSGDSFAWAIFVVIYGLPLLVILVGASSLYRMFKAKRGR